MLGDGKGAIGIGAIKDAVKESEPPGTVVISVGYSSVVDNVRLLL